MLKVLLPLGLAVLLGGGVGRSFQSLGSEDQAMTVPAACAEDC